ncbi:MAG: chromosome segregation protein SMC [Ruminococcaceae bacterium]|nr:chromosome segregation protein SMC [Oscillospiraceae bacterium]
MVLKCLDIQGFKSFPDRTHIEFNRGITAVVGPNGSGKSNISDAIRWVLGEQSTKTLRGAKMEDVVFAGAGSRRAMASAEVSLTIDNTDGGLRTDYTEVTVTRRYYRSGDSEFFINRKLVRLRDIHELFMDTGLGRDGYSIIGQGKIDEILSVKSEERREVFDEAAGISKYRYRREEAQRRLQDAQDNLTRIGDIIAELESRLGPLEKEAEKERRYNALRGELKGLEVSTIMLTLDGMNDRLTAAQRACETFQVDLEQSHRHADELSALSDQLLRDTAELQRQLEELRGAVRQAELDASRAESEIALFTAEIAHNERDRERMVREREDFSGRQKETEEQIAASERAYAEKLSEEEEARRQALSLESVREGLRRESEELSARRMTLMQQDAALREQAGQAMQDIRAAEGSREELLRQLAMLDADGPQRAAALEKAEADQRAAEAALRVKDEEIPSLQNIVNGFRLKKDSRARRVEQLAEQIQTSAIALADVQNRVRLLRDLEREYEGFNKAVRLVMRESASGGLRGIHGPISKLMQVADDYVAATEIALGAAMQNIVTDSEETARRAIGLLKSRDAGRATFLPLTSVRGSRLSERGLEDQPGFLGILSDIISYDERYRGVFQNLLGRTVLVETLEDAIAIARVYAHRFRIVTLDGQVMNAGGSMTGGSLNRSAGILSRANEIAKLSASLGGMEQKLADQRAAYEEANRENHSLLYQLELAENELRSAEADRVRIAAEREHLRTITETLSADLSEREERRQDMQRRIAATEEQREKSAAAHAMHLRSAGELAGQLAALEEAQNALGERLRDSEERIARCREGITRLAAEGRAARDQAAVLRAQLASAAADTGRREAELLALDQRDIQCREKIEELQEILAAQKDLGVRQSAALDALNQQRNDLERRREENQRAIRDENNRMISLEREKAYADNQLKSIEGEQDTLVARLWDQYELTRTTAREFCIEIPNRSEANARMDTLKRQIRAIGNIYPGAEAEYAAVSERYTFMTAQRDDAETSRKEIEDIIADIGSRMTELFREQFTIIAEEFSKTFVEIFGGGSARVELSDPKDLLGSGIEIYVQPPGKTPKVLSLLSGGERALAAISLYFAILKVRPAPFCVLDEIESALDEVNVRRFARYLRKLTDDTQFIVISHRRGTMEEADMLYGVTMPQQGVSRLLALNISEAERDFIKD